MHDQPPIESQFLTLRQAQAMLRMVESAPAIRRRAHFFMWMQGHVQSLVPHVLAVCGAYSRHRRQLEFDVFNSVALSPVLMAQLSSSQSSLMAVLARCWIEGDGQPLILRLSDPEPGDVGSAWEELRRAGLTYAAIHGVSRPERRYEIESLFLLAGRNEALPERLAETLELLIPHLHMTYVRTHAMERELPMPAAAASLPVSETRLPGVTVRERQILHWVREGMSNQQIGDQLAISPLTVKNHVQKILRKLGASNRAQAVAMALQARLITSSGAEFARGAQARADASDEESL